MSEICCSQFDPSPWHNKEHTWENKLFVKGYVTQIFHMPLNMGSIITKLFKEIKEANAETAPEHFLMLAYDPSPWKSEIYISVSKEVPGMENVKLSGRFLTKVFDGPFNTVPEWIKEFDKDLEEKKEKLLRYYFYYTTCPKCTKKYGHNYVVAFAQIEE